MKYTNFFKEEFVIFCMAKTLISKTFRSESEDKLDEMFNRYAKEKSIGPQDRVKVSFAVIYNGATTYFNKSITYFSEKKE